MQTMTFVRSLQDIIKKLRVTELCDYLQNILDPTQNLPLSDEYRTLLADLVFEAREGYAACMLHNEAKTIVESIGISSIFSSKSLSQILTAINSQPDTAAIYSEPHQFALFQSFYSNLKTCLAFSQTLETHLLKQKVSSAAETDKTLEIEILDYEGNGLLPGKLAAILESLHKLHGFVTKIMEDKSAKLTISYMDSGSDFILGLQSSFKAIEIMRTLFQQFWQRIRFKAAVEIEKNSDSLTKSLNIMQHISRQEKNGVFDAETAGKLKAAIHEEMVNLIAAGVLLKEFEQEEKFDRRKLLHEKREIKTQSK
ncbi:MAG: hypothetical protein HY965_00065 [Ignavibacteriales bacterium]|nr:hypothetical protein [Ignavibacteriales bacterium]